MPWDGEAGNVPYAHPSSVAVRMALVGHDRSSAQGWKTWCSSGRRTSSLFLQKPTKRAKGVKNAFSGLSESMKSSKVTSEAFSKGLHYSSPTSTTGISWTLVSARSAVKNSWHCAASAHPTWRASGVLRLYFTLISAPLSAASVSMG